MSDERRDYGRAVYRTMSDDDVLMLSFRYGGLFHGGSFWRGAVGSTASGRVHDVYEETKRSDGLRTLGVPSRSI